MGLSSLFNKKVVSIDLGSYETKVVEGRVKNKEVEINKCFSFLTPEKAYENGYIINKELLSYSLEEGLSKNEIRTKNAYMNIKSSSVFTREITLPNVGKEEIDGILKYKLEEYLPIATKEYIVQYRTMGKTQENHRQKQNILLIAIPKEIVEGHFCFLKNIDLEPKVLDFQSNSIAKLIDYSFSINNKYETKEKTFALIDLGHSSTNITILKDGYIQVARIIDVGGKDLKKDIVNESAEDIMGKIHTVFKYYISREIENEIHSILLCGGLSNIENVDKLFEDYYNIPTILIENIDGIFIMEDTNKYMNCIGSLIRNEDE